MQCLPSMLLQCFCLCMAAHPAQLGRESAFLRDPDSILRSFSPHTRPLPCTRLGSGWKGAVSFSMSKLYIWETFATPHLLASNGPSHNKVRTTVSQRFHKNSESLQETAMLAGDLTKVHTPVVKLPRSFLQETVTKKNLKKSEEKLLSALKRHCEIPL